MQVASEIDKKGSGLDPSPRSKPVSLPNKKTMQIYGLNVDMYTCVCVC